jgi:hypothetical protein
VVVSPLQFPPYIVYLPLGEALDEFETTTPWSCGRLMQQEEKILHPIVESCHSVTNPDCYIFTVLVIDE